MRKFICLVAACIFTVTSANATSISYMGVGLSGGEDGNPEVASDNVYGYDYIYPTIAEVDYFHSLGFTFIRLPVLWERLQPVMNGPLSTVQLAYIEPLITEARKNGMGVIVDSHDYGQGFGYDIGSTQTPASAFVDYWTLMAQSLKSYPNVIFAINNEPHNQTAASWESIEQQVITAIRAQGDSQEILASGVGWDGGESWVADGNDILSNLTDPLKKTVIEVHQYLDTGNTGTACTIASQASADLAGVTAWAKSAGLKLWLGEIGVCSDSTSLAALTAAIQYLDANSSVWQGMTGWAGGPWMGSYMYTLDPSSTNVESAQTATIMGSWK